MKKGSVFLLIVSILLLFNFASAQKDPYDPNEADTLYFTAGGQHSSDGDTLYLPPGATGGDVVILINFWNDNGIAAFTIPLIEGCYGPPGNASLSSAKNADTTGLGYPVCFEGSAVEGFDLLEIELSLYPDSHKVLYGAVTFGDTVDPGNWLFATMTYTLSDTTTICLDTTKFPPENRVLFTTPNIIGYRPIVLPDTFHVGWRTNKAPVVDAPERDSVAIKDTIEIVFTADDPDNDSLLDTPEIEIIPDCGGFDVARTDTGAFTGSWKLSFYATTGCSLRTYQIIMRVEDIYGAKGEDTTEIIVWKPNRPPYITAPDPLLGYTDVMHGYWDTVTFTFSAYDPDSDIVWLESFSEPYCAGVLSLDTISGAGTFNPVWKVSIITGNCATGNYKVYMGVEDERGEIAFDSSILELDVKPSSPPVVQAPDETLSVWVDYELSFTFYAFDPDSHKLLDSASISVAPSCGDTCQYWVERLWGSGGPSGEWQIQFNPYRSDSDYYHIYLDITDDHDSTSYDTVVVHVYPRPNYNPEVFAPPTNSTHINDTLQYVFTAFDPDSNKLLDIASITVQPDCGTYSAVKQAGPYFFAGTWKLTFYTVGCDTGVYDVTVEVKDVRDGVGYDATAILLTDRPNSAPVVVAPYLVEGMTGQILTFDFSAMDPDTDDIVDLANVVVTPNCGLSFANRTAGIGSYTGIWELTFKTTGCDTGEYEVTIEVQDVYGKLGYALSQVKLKKSTDVEEEEELNVSIDRFALNQNYPNPFNLSTEITFQLPVESKVSLKIYNTKGQLVRSLIDDEKSKGFYSISWDGKDQSGKEVASGIYFYRLAAGNFRAIKKMVMLK